MDVGLIFLTLAYLCFFSWSLYVAHAIYNAVVFIKIKNKHKGSAADFLNSLVSTELKFREKDVESYAFQVIIWNIAWYVISSALYYVLFFIVNDARYVFIEDVVPITLVPLMVIVAVLFACKVDISNIKEAKTQLNFFIFRFPIFINFNLIGFRFKSRGKVLPLGYIPSFDWLDKSKPYCVYLSILDKFEKLFFLIPFIAFRLAVPYLVLLVVAISVIKGDYYGLILVPVVILLWAFQMAQIKESILAKLASNYQNLSKILVYVITTVLVITFILFALFTIYMIAAVVYLAVYTYFNPTEAHSVDKWYVYAMAIILPLVLLRNIIKFKKGRNQ